jgi:phosphohistidine phosphatase
MRHAKSSWKDASMDDRARPLSKRGEKDAPRMGKHLLEKHLVPEIILASPAKRTLDTAQLVAEKSEFEGEIRQIESLYMGEPQAYLEELARLDNRYNTVLVIGHNPGLESLLQILADTMESLPTASVAVVELPIDNWADVNASLRGKLVKIWKPKDL